jgi:hypothetical protein
MEIAREARSLESAFAWSAVAGDNLAKVVEYEIHRRAKPESFTKAGLQKMMELDDKLVITRLASLQQGARDTLFELDTRDLKSLSRALDENQLDSLAGYLTSLSKPAAQRVMRVVAQTPSRMAELARPGVREAILASSDQSAAVGMMLQSSNLPDPTVLFDHTRLVLDGKVSPRLLWEKHPVSLGMTALLALILLLVIKRLVFPARPKIVVRHGAAGLLGGGRRGGR